MKIKIGLYPYLLWIAFFVIVPITMVLLFAFSSSSGVFTLENVVYTAKYSAVFVRSIILGLISTVVCLILGYPMA